MDTVNISTTGASGFSGTADYSSLDWNTNARQEQVGARSARALCTSSCGFNSRV